MSNHISKYKFKEFEVKILWWLIYQGRPKKVNDPLLITCGNLAIGSNLTSLNNMYVAIVVPFT